MFSSLFGGGSSGASAGGSFTGSGSIGGLGQSLFDAGLSELAAHQAWKRQEKMLTHQMQWRVEDLKKAGLNPMLAITGGMGGGGGGSVPMAHGPSTNIASVMQALGQNKAVNAQVSLTDSQRDLNLAQASKLRSEIDLNEVLKPYYTAKGTEAYSSAREAEARTRVLQETLPKLTAEIQNIQSDTKLKDAQVLMTRAEEMFKNMSTTEKATLLPFLRDLYQSDALRAKLGLAEASNKSEMEQTWWGKVRHYLPDMPFVFSRR